MLRRLLSLILLSWRLAGAQPRFDAAEIKPARSNLGGRPSPTPMGAEGANLTLKNLIERARGFDPSQISGGPSWVESAAFNLIVVAGHPIDLRERL